MEGKIMGFWPLIVLMVLCIVVIEAIKDVAKHRVIKNKDLEKLEQDISEIKKELSEIKEYLADIIIKTDGI